MGNERITESIVRDKFRELGYMDINNNIFIEEQKSQNETIKRCLQYASKRQTKKIGYPEFIISSPTTPDFVIVVECKADKNKHKSESLNEVADYAVDGVLHYMKFLSKEYNVLGVAVSGNLSNGTEISTYIMSKNNEDYNVLTNEAGMEIKDIIPFSDYNRLASYDKRIEKIRHDELMKFSQELHEFMRDHAKLTESEKPLLVSGTLIALRNAAFAKTFDLYTPEKLQKEWLRVIGEEIESAEIPKSKKDNMVQPYSSIGVHPELGKSTIKWSRGVLYELIKRLNEKVWPFMTVYHDYDIVGQFYGEFLKYTGGDKKSLGIVLTPRHITELFAELANLKVTQKGSKIQASKVLDICAGTGGFLIASMQNMLKKATTEKQQLHIRKNCLVGIEQQPNMYALAASNMILRGDGKANMYQGSCFDEGIMKEVISHECNVGMVNPPYSQTDADLHELRFVQQMLNSLVDGGIGIAIVPMSCAIAPHPMKAELLKNHTLEAVMSLPDDLFYPVGVVPCIMVFTAGVPHSSSEKKTWFAYWKDDGFIKTKKRGRVDENLRWYKIKRHWISSYRNREVHPGESVMQMVSADDEWSAEAYMQTDYSVVTREVYEETVMNFVVSRLLNNMKEGK